MQIRRVKNRYQLIRYAGFEKATRKIKTTMVGSVPIGSKIVPEEVRVKLSSEEYVALVSRLTADHLARQPADDRLMLSTILETLAAVSRAIRIGEHMPSADAIRAGITELHAALRERVGPGKTVVRKKKQKPLESVTP